MNIPGRVSWLYELARAQTDHEQQISAELSTRGGLLAALAALLAVGLTEFRHYSGSSFLLIFSVVLLGIGVGCLLYASWGIDYERPGSAQKWAAWAKSEGAKGRHESEIDADLLDSVCEDYCLSAETGVRANGKKAPLFNLASRCLVGSLFFLILALLWISFHH